MCFCHQLTSLFFLSWLTRKRNKILCCTDKRTLELSDFGCSRGRAHHTVLHTGNPEWVLQRKRLGQRWPGDGAPLSSFTATLNEWYLPCCCLLPHWFQRAVPAHQPQSCTCWPGVHQKRGCAHTGILLMVCPLHACRLTQHLHWRPARVLGGSRLPCTVGARESMWANIG